MYIDILLGLVFFASLYLLWRSIMRKIPELAAIPDEEISVLLEENTAKLHWFILHIFHFRIFYRERHYQDKFWNFSAKVIFKIHILILRLDNGLMSILKRIRTNREGVEPGSIPGDYIKQLSEETRLSDENERKSSMQEVKPRRRTHIADSGGIKPKNSGIELPKTSVNDINESSISLVRSRRSALPRRVRRDASQPGMEAFTKPSEVDFSNREV